jgi:CspA family cold shock protein
METGTVKRFNKIKGYGFIAPDKGSNEVFVHFSQIQLAGYKELKEGQRIGYKLENGDRGEFATNVQLLSE